MRKRWVSTLLLLLAFIVGTRVPRTWAADPVEKALDRFAASRLGDTSAIDDIFKHLDITTKADEAKFLEKIRVAAEAHHLKNPRHFEQTILKSLDKKRFATVDGLLQKVYHRFGKDLDVVVRTGSSGIRYLELAGKRSDHRGYRLLFSDDDISFVGKKAVQAARYFNELLEKEGLESLKVKGFDIVHLKNVRGVDLHMLNLLEEEKFVGEASMSGIKKEMLIKGAVIAENKGGQLVPHAETLNSYVKAKVDSILAGELDAKMIREAVKKYGSLTMVGSCERQITKAHGGWKNLSDAEKVKYVLRERLALKESGALESIAGMDARGIEAQIERLKALKAKGKLTKGELRWLKRVRARNVTLAFEEIPFKLKPILAKARVSGRSLAGNREVRKALDELTVGFVLMREHVLDVPEKEILKKLQQMAGGDKGLYKMLYTSFQDGKMLIVELDAWLKAGLSREAFVKVLLEAENRFARLELIKARRAALEKGSEEAKTLREAEKALASEKGDRFLVKMMKNPAARKVLIGTLAVTSGAYIFKKMYDSWMAGNLENDLSNAAMVLVEFVPGVTGFKLWHEEGLTPRVVFSFVKEALYFTPYWPLVLTGDLVSMGVDVQSALRVQYNHSGLVDILVYAGEYSDDGRFIRLKLPKKVANKRRVIPKGELEDFFFKTKVVVVPVSGMKNNYRISDLAKVSNEILDKYFVSNDPVSKKLSKAAETQLEKIRRREALNIINNPFSGVFEYTKYLAGFKSIYDKSPDKWGKFFQLLQKKIKERREFIKKNVMIPTIIQQAERKHVLWVMGNHPPVDELNAIQKKLEELRDKPLEVNLAKQVSKHAAKAAKKAAENNETREQQKLKQGKIWVNALKIYGEIYKQNRKMLETIIKKFDLPAEEVQRRILRFPWTGDYEKDAKNAEASRKGFYHAAWTAWKDTRNIKGATPDPIQVALDREALSILAKVQFRWRMAMDRLGHSEKAITSSSTFKKEYKIALQKVRALYGKAGDFQALVEKEAKIIHSPLRLGKQTVFAVKITGKKLKKMRDKGILKVTWRSPHGAFGSNGRGFKVNYATRHLLPVTVEAVLQNRLDSTATGTLSVVVPVAVPRGVFRLTLTPPRPQPKEFIRAEVEMPDRYLNAYQFHYEWRGKGCRVEDDDRSHVVVTAPRSGTATVAVAVYAENKKGKRVMLGSDTVSFTVTAEKKPEKKKKTAKKKNKKTVIPESPPRGTRGGIESANGTGGGAGTGGSPGEKPGRKKPKRIVKHGAGGSASGMYPARTFNGMQISYSVSGASMPKMKDEHDFTTSRHYEGRLGSGTLSVSGTARMTWEGHIDLSVSVSAGSKHAEKTYKFEGPGSRSFNLKIPIPDDASGGEFSIDMGGSYGNGEVRGLVVSGTFTENGPVGKAPKGTEDLSVKLTGPKHPVQAGKKVEIAADVRGGRFPYRYTWSGATGSGEKGTFQNAMAGPHTVTLKVTDADGHTASGSVKVVVESPEFEVTGLPARPVYASKARLRVRVKRGGKGSYKPIWQASELGIEFNPPEGMETTVTFGRIKKVAIWVQVPQPAGGKTIESKQVHAQVVGPKFSLKLNPRDPYVGQEVRGRIVSSAKIPPDAIRWVWSSPPSSNRMEVNDPASEIGFKVKDDKPLPLQAEARVPHYGDVIGTIRDKIRAKSYEVKVTVLGPTGPKPRVWKEGKGLVEVKKAIAVHQNVRLTAKVTPVPKGTAVYYTWTLNEDSHFAGLSTGKDVTVNRSRTGTCVATVVVKDKDGTILGKGKGSFSVTISQAQITKGLQQAKDQKEAAKLLRQANNQWFRGRLGEAIATLKKARSLDPSNKNISRVLGEKERKKARIDGDLKKADAAIRRGNLKEAGRLLNRQPKFVKRYLPYENVSKRLQAALEKEKEKKERLAKAKALRESARASWKRREYQKAIATLEKAVELDPKNSEAKKTLADWQEKVKRYAQADKYRHDGALLEAAGELKDAVAAYKKSLALRPDEKLKRHVGDLEKKIAEQEKKVKVAQTSGKNGGKKPQKGSQKPLSEDDIFGGKEGSTKKKPQKGLTIEDILPGKKGPGKTVPPKKVASGSGKKPLSIDDIFGDDQKAPGEKSPSVKQTPIKSGGGKRGPPKRDLEKQRDRLIREGYAAEKAGRFEEAIRKYTEAQKIRKDAKVDAHIRQLRVRLKEFDRLIQLGYAYEKKGDYPRAIAIYKKALTIHSDAKVMAHIRDLERKMAKSGKTSSPGKAVIQGTTTLRHGIWVLTKITGKVGEARNSSGSYYRYYISGREGRIVMTNTIKKNGHVIFKTVSIWRRPPNRLTPGSKVAFPLYIHKLVDPRQYSVNHILSMDTQDVGCGATRGGGRIGSVEVYSVHSPQNPTVRKTFYWKVPEGRKGKTLTLRVCYFGGFGFRNGRGWKYYYTWVPAGSPVPKGIQGGTVKGTLSGKGPKPKISTSSTYSPNTKGDVFKGGRWGGSRGKSDWLQKDFGRVVPISGIYIGRASTDITTRGFRLVLKLKRPDGRWVVVDELRNTNINRSKLSNGKIGRSIPPYTKRISPSIPATAFRLEFYGHGWFDAADIRFYTPRKKSVKSKKLPWTGTYRYSLKDKEGSIDVTLQLTQSGTRLTGVIRAKAVAPAGKGLNFDIRKKVTGVCSGNRGKIKMEGQPYDKVVLLENGRKLSIYDAEDNKKYVLHRVR